MKNLLPILFVLFWILIYSTGCSSPQKLLENGDYDAAMNRALEKIKNKNNKAKHVATLEIAYAKANERDYKKINQLKQNTESYQNIKLYETYNKIERRQRKIRSVLPVQDNNGYVPTFIINNLSASINNYRLKSAEHYYNQGTIQFEEAKRGNRLSARKATKSFENVHRYEKYYKNTNDLLEEAIFLGQTNILFRIENNSSTQLPKNFEQAVLKMSVKDLNSKWKKFHMYFNEKILPHYYIKMNLIQIAVSPEQILEKEHIDHADIEVGVENVVDNAGNNVVDSTGKVVTRAKIQHIECKVLTQRQLKTAKVSGFLEIYNHQNKQLLKRIPISSEAIFENIVGRFRGDRRALTRNSQALLGNNTLPFPSNDELFIQAAEQIKPNIKAAIRNNRALLK